MDKGLFNAEKNMAVSDADNEETKVQDYLSTENHDEDLKDSDYRSFNNGRQFSLEDIKIDNSKDFENGSSSCCVCCKPCKPARKTSDEKHLTLKERRKEACWNCCKKFTTFLFSHIGLCALVVAYSVLGGFVFMYIEAGPELEERNNVEINRKIQIEKLWNITNIQNVFSKVNWTLKVEMVMKAFQDEIFLATKVRGWDGKGVDAEPRWTFANSLLYSITVITTIGYGHIAPKTIIGKFVTIVYAMIGIPITLLCLANLGSFLGKCFRSFYKHFCLLIICLCCPSQAKWTSNRKERSRSKSPPDKSSEHELEILSKKESPVEILRKKEIPVTFAEDILSKKESPTEISRKSEIPVSFSEKRMSSVHHIQVVKVKVVEKSSKEQVRVPIFVSLMLIVLYIFAGAVLFSEWEGWPLLDGAYFCFITLSTIGFGDLVPGDSSDSLSNQEKLIICTFYLIFGLSIIAMCFDLMVEEVIAKFKWLGEKIGMIDNQNK